MHWLNKDHCDSFSLQHDRGNEGPGQVGSDGQDRHLLFWSSSYGAGHSAGGQQLPGSGIYWNLPR